MPIPAAEVDLTRAGNLGIPRLHHLAKFPHVHLLVETRRGISERFVPIALFERLELSLDRLAHARSHPGAASPGESTASTPVSRPPRSPPTPLAPTAGDSALPFPPSSDPHDAVTRVHVQDLARDPAGPVTRKEHR